jgi:hypothetical protein
MGQSARASGDVCIRIAIQTEVAVASQVCFSFLRSFVHIINYLASSKRIFSESGGIGKKIPPIEADLWRGSKSRRS